MPQESIRNFCIIAHIDAGKSTLADRFLELTKTVPEEKMKPQYLDQMSLERERGITIKLQPVTMNYTLNAKPYTLNLIDTPGHVDFSYEVSRSLAAVEGVVLLVDAGQGIQAQTLSNLYLAQEQNLAIIPVINKIDLPNVDLAKRKKELADLLKINQEEIILTSAKNGQGVNQVLESVVKKIPAPKGKAGAPLRALIFDSFFDEYQGAIAYVRIVDGRLMSEDKIQLIAATKTIKVQNVGIFGPELKPTPELATGQIGYIATGMKDIESCRVGDTITIFSDQLAMIKPLSGYQEVKPMVFAGLYSQDGAGEKLRNGLMKLKLNDASLALEPEYSPVLGSGFRAGFLGLLHLDIVSQRLKREYNLNLTITVPSVAYKVILKEGGEIMVKSPQDLPDPTKIEAIWEPWMKVDIITPDTYMGSVMELVKKRKGRLKSSEYLGKRLILHIEMPLALLLIDFYDKLKSVSSGYASMSYDFCDWRPTRVIKLDILVAGELVPALSSIVYEDSVYPRARQMAVKLKQTIPRQLFEVKIQASVGGKIVAAERIPPMRKDVTAKLYGGDVTRKMKLLKKQKKGKKKMRDRGKVRIPPEAYLAVLKR